MSKRKTTTARAAKPRTPPAAKWRRGTASVVQNPLSLRATTEEDQTEAPTERQMEIYSFIRDKIHSRGYGPTVREIGLAIKIR